MQPSVVAEIQKSKLNTKQKMSYTRSIGKYTQEDLLAF